MIQAIQWDVTPQIIEGWSTPNLYGLMFVSGLIIGYFVIRKMFRKEGVADDVLDKLVFYMVIATIVGARLGHVLFYGPYWDSMITINGVEQIHTRGYFSHPFDILKVRFSFFFACSERPRVCAVPTEWEGWTYTHC